MCWVDVAVGLISVVIYVAFVWDPKAWAFQRISCLQTRVSLS